MRVLASGIALSTLIAVSACNSTNQTGGPGSMPMAPTTTAAAHVLTVDVVEINGPYSFYPSPAIGRADQTVVWRNSDTVTHHVVFDNGSIDTGTLAPGTLSQPMTIGLGDFSYHCSIHPTMVGSITVTSSVAAGQISDAGVVR
jgi:plastocyanin